MGIEKDGGCDHMTCRCGHSFNWSQVPIMETSASRPCNCVHSHPDYGVWGTTCPNSTLTAGAKLMARRTGLVVVGVPTAVAGSVVVGALVLSAGAIVATNVAVSNLKSAVGSTVENVKSALESPITKAQRAVEEAEVKVQCEEAKWFNWAAIAQAKESSQENRRLLQDLQQVDTNSGETR